MERSTKQAWLDGPGDLATAEVEDVPVKGMSVKVQALSAAYSAAVQAQLRIEQDGAEQVARLDVPTMELLQFTHGCVEPQFTEAEARQVQEKYGAAFRKVIAKLDEISGLDKEAIADAEIRFQAGEAAEGGSAGVAGTSHGDSRSDVPVRVGA